MEPKIDQSGSLKNNSQGSTDRQTVVLPVFRVIFTEKLEEEKSPYTVEWSHDQVRQSKMLDHMISFEINSLLNVCIG